MNSFGILEERINRGGKNLDEVLSVRSFFERK